jgi:hypothetical protein
MSIQTLDALKAAITLKPPFCTGAITLSSNDGYVFYRLGEDPKAEYVSDPITHLGTRGLTDVIQVDRSFQGDGDPARISYACLRPSNFRPRST